MYPAYVIAPTKATWENGFPLPPQYLSLEEDAQKVADGVGGKLINGVDFFKQFGFDFKLDPADPRQPWMVTVNGSTSFAGLSLLDPVSNTGMYAPNKVNGGGKGNPGQWKQDPTSKQFVWDPTAPPPPPPPPPVMHPNDAAAFALAEGATSLTTEQFDKETLYWLRAIGARLGIPGPNA